jgi:signal transduction histidine kinase
MGMRRMRSKIFTINVGHFNKKIRVKYDKEMKALALAASKKSGKEKRADMKAKRQALRSA